MTKIHLSDNVFSFECVTNLDMSLRALDKIMILSKLFNHKRSVIK